jgi:hypothetical protein
MSNKFLSFLEHAGQNFAKGLHFVLPIAAGAGEVAVAAFAPALGPMFNSTVAAVVLAEQKYTALGQQTGSGPKKLADVLQLVEPVVAAGLADAGKDHSTAAVTGYINSVVNVLNAAPAPVTA